MGSTDELISSITPDENLHEKIISYKKLKTRNISIAVGLYFLAVASLIGIASLSAISGNKAKIGGIIGLLTMFILSAIATGLIIYTHISIPKEVEPFIKDLKNNEFDKSTKQGRFFQLFLNFSGLIITIIYLGLSFLTEAWNITWLIWLIGAALSHTIKLIYIGQQEENKTNE